MVLPAAVSPAIVGKNSGRLNIPRLVLGQNIIVEDSSGMFRKFAGMQISEDIAAIGVPHGLEVNPAYSL